MPFKIHLGRWKSDETMIWDVFIHYDLLRHCGNYGYHVVFMKQRTSYGLRLRKINLGNEATTLAITFTECIGRVENLALKISVS